MSDLLDLGATPNLDNHDHPSELMTLDRDNSRTVRFESPPSELGKRSRTNPMNVQVPSNWALKWTVDEDQRLLGAIKDYGDQDWKKIAERVVTRDASEFV
jgi:hypothetical protein